MKLEEARQLASRKCSTPACWHRPTKGYIYCRCCLWGPCAPIIEQERAQIQAALEVLHIDFIRRYSHDYER